MEKTRNIDTRKNLKVVTDNCFITAKGLSKISLKARKLLYLTIAQCKVNDEHFYRYDITISQFADIMGIDKSHLYQEAFNITKELSETSLTFLFDDEKEFEHMPVVSFCKYLNNVISIELNTRMVELFLKLDSNFSKPLLSDFMRMKSPYSMAIWHLFQKEMQSKKPGTKRIDFYVSLEELRIVTGTEKQKTYDILSNFKNRIFDKALREISEKCGVEITYSNRKRGHTVVGFDCTALNWLGLDLTNYNPSEKTKNKIRKFELQEQKKVRELTDEEIAEYENLCQTASQLEFDL